VKRYFLAPILLLNDGEFDYYASKIQTYSGIQYDLGVIPSNEDGTPVLAWTIALLDTAAQVRVADDTGITPLPLVGYSTLISALDSGEYAAVEAACTGYGIDISSIQSTDTFGDLVALLAQLTYPVFSVNNYPL
jgi:hypothetical protein